MAHKKGQGSIRNGRDSVSKRLGVKEFGGEVVSAGSIIIRQRGSKFEAGQNVVVDGADRLRPGQIVIATAAPQRGARGAGKSFATSGMEPSSPTGSASGKPQKGNQQ